MEAIYGIVKCVTIFLIMIAVIMNLFGESAYKKYISLFAGMVLVLIVATPIFKFLQRDDWVSYYLNQSQLSLQENSMIDELIIADEKSKGTIFKQYKEIIHSQIEGILNKSELSLSNLDLTICEDSKDETYGQIQKIEVVASQTKQNKESTNEKVRIGNSEIDPQKSVLDNLSENMDESQIRKEIAETYQLDESKIKVKIKN